MLSSLAQAQTVLRPGDIVLTGVTSSGLDEFGFVPLVDLAAGTQIQFTDNGWLNSTNQFRTANNRLTEGIATYTVPANTTITKGTLILFKHPGTQPPSPNFTLSGSFALAADLGDQILAYQGTTAAPTFIYGLSTRGKGWGGASSANTSDLPAALVSGTSAVSVGYCNAYQNPLTSQNQNNQRKGTAAMLRTWFSTGSSWLGSNTLPTTNPTTTAYQNWDTTNPFNQSLTVVDEGQVPDADELQALQDLFTYTTGSNWSSRQHWPTGTTPWPGTLTNADFATWEGVTVTGGDVTALDLPAHQLTGVLPASLSKLTRLTRLNLTSNQLQDELPVEWRTLTQLTTLQLSHNQLDGILPVNALRQWTQLQLLDLSYNTLVGPLPGTLGQCGQLQQLMLASNGLRGSLPDSLRLLAQLTALDVSSNQLTGSLPASWSQLSQLTKLNVAGNRLSGAIPTSLTILPHLAVVYLFSNQLTGTIPVFAGDPAAGVDVRVDDNQFTDLGNYGQLPMPSAGRIQLSVTGNQLAAAPLEANLSGPDYGPQTTFLYLYANQHPPTPDDAATYLVGQSLTLHRDVTAQHTQQLQWERQVGEAWTEVPGATSTDLVVASASPGTRGRYRLRYADNWLLTNQNAGPGPKSQAMPMVFYTRAISTDPLPYAPLAQNRPTDQVAAPTQFDNQPPTSRTGATDIINYVRTWMPREAMTNAALVPLAAVDLVSQTTQYVDGLGRPVQTVQRQASPGRHDLVQPVAYDGLGRETRQYLPYVRSVTDGTDGGYRPDALNEQYHYYRDLPVTGPPSPQDLTTGVARTGYPYAERLFDDSPLNKVLVQGQAGESWQLATNNNVSQTERPNVASDSVWYFTAGYSGQPNDLIWQQSYAAGQLWGTQTTDEHGYRTINWKDKAGQLVLKQVEGTNHADYTRLHGTRWLRTAYVYDDLGRLRFVLQPEAVKEFARNGQQVSTRVLAFTFTYRYDARGRQVAKQVPGTQGETWVVYDQLDRPVLSQDARQRGRQQWSWSKYDALGRPVLTGVVGRNATRETLQAEADAASGQYEQRTTDAASPQHYTTTQAYPPLGQGGFGAGQALTTTYYDDYDFDNDGQADADAQFDNGTNDALNDAVRPDLWRTRGLVTRTLTRVLSPGAGDAQHPAWLATTTFYDDRARPVQVQTLNARGYVDVVTSDLDFTGKVRQSVSRHQGPNLTTPLLVYEAFTYDHAGRLLSTRQQLPTEAAPAPVASLQYNELGQLTRKTIGSGRLRQDVKYAYNIRGWLTGINDPYQPAPQDLFNLSLHYEHGFTGYQYNGNLTGQTWRGRDGVQRAYGYLYDPENRLLQGDYVARAGAATGTLATAQPWNQETDNFQLAFMSYDDNGNIRTLRRRGLLAKATRLAPAQYGDVDNLQYSYLDNRLGAVEDQITGNALPQPATYYGAPTSLAGDFQLSSHDQQHYFYDENGNLTQDANKHITNIVYNYLNLPRQIHFGSVGDSVVFRYTAAGQKVAKLVYQTNKTVQRTDYLGPFQYEQDSLHFFPHAEGRVLRFGHLDPAGQEHPAYPREFTLKDHLGNLRLAYRAGQVLVYKATLEVTPASVHQQECQQFDSLSVSKPIAVDVSNVGGRNWAYTGSYVASLNAGSGQALGPLLQLAVQKGDTLSALAYGLYRTPVSDGSFGFSLLSFITSLLHPGGSPTPTGPDGSPRRRDLPLLQLGLSAGVSTLPQLGGGVPKGYLRVLFFNRDSALVDQRVVQLPQSAYQNYQQLQLSGLIAPQDGYATVYVGNESAVDVYFDDLRIEQRQGLQVQENQYEPWGLSLAGVEYQSPGVKPLNRYQFNGKEREGDLGLNWSDYGARLYDWQLGRWQGVDPLVDKMRRYSPYNYCFDNPIRFIDPDGMAPLDDYKLLRNGKIELIKKTADKVDKLFATDKNGKVDPGKSLEVKKGVLDKPINTRSPDGGVVNTYYQTGDNKTTDELFRFAGANSDVEFGKIVAHKEGGGDVGVVGTSHTQSVNWAINDLEYQLTFYHKSMIITEVSHSHPTTDDYNNKFPSGFNSDGSPNDSNAGDRQNAFYFDGYHPNVTRSVYIPSLSQEIIFDSKRIKGIKNEK